MAVEVQVALLFGLITLLGWFVKYRSDRTKQKLEAALQYTERQLEDLYGPLAFLMWEGNQSFRNLKQDFGRDDIYIPDMSDEDIRTWLFWVDNDFMPRNEEIKNY
jgi:hypothetical protein